MWCYAFWLVIGGCHGYEPPSMPEHAVGHLLALLRDPQADVRRAAAESLGKIGDLKTGPALIPLLTDQAASVREAAVQAIGRLGTSAGEEPSQAVANRLDDPDEAVRRAVAIAIGELEPVPRMLAGVPKLLTSREVSIRRTVAQALSMVDARAWLPDLVKALQDSDAEVRQHVVVALAELGDPVIVPLLRDRLIRDPSVGVRAEAAYRLGKIGGTDGNLALVEAVKHDRDLGVRRWAQASLDDATLAPESGSMR